MTTMLDFSPVLLLVIGLLAAIGLWLLVTGLVNLFRGRLLRGPLRSAVGAASGAVAIALAAIAMNLHTYQRLNYERPVAHLEFQQVAPRQFEARIVTAGGAERFFDVHGDEWQLDARVLKWKGAGALLGLDPRYRLERFSGRYTSMRDEQRATRSVYGLHEGDAGLDVWTLSQEYDRWLPFVDSIYGSAAYMPMRDKAQYTVVITEDGLVARLENPQRAPR